MTVDACDECLRRTDLIAALGGRIEIEWKARRRSRLLALGDGKLLAWAADPALRQRYRGFDSGAAGGRILAAGLSASCRCRPGFPARLLELPDPPAVLHVLGDPHALEEGDSVAIVGARAATPYGLEVARALGRGAAAAGLPVVSGMALGIDAAAHAGALDALDAAGPTVAESGPTVAASGPTAPAGPTVAVMACGADIAYPAGKRRLHERIAATGCVVSEMPPGFRPFRWCFPARNRIIAALAGATVIVEAAERSGSLITADFAMELGRAVGAVPGPVTSPWSRGANALLKSGAEVVRDPQDVLDLLFGAGARAAPAPAAEAGLAPDLRRVLADVERGRGSVAALASTPDQARAAARALGELEARGLVRRTFGGGYVRAL